MQKGAVPVSPPSDSDGGIDGGLGQSEASGLEMNLANDHLVTLYPDFCLLSSLMHHFGVHATRYDMTLHKPAQRAQYKSAVCARVVREAGDEGGRSGEGRPLPFRPPLASHSYLFRSLASWLEPG